MEVLDFDTKLDGEIIQRAVRLARFFHQSPFVFLPESYVSDPRTVKVLDEEVLRLCAEEERAMKARRAYIEREVGKYH